jgi:hypothetical protein
MRSKSQAPEHERVIDDIEAKLKNTVWPDTMINSRSVDAFLWKGDPDAPLVQRVGAWIFGLFFILGGVGWATAAYEKQSPLVGLLSIGWFLIGGKVFLNGFRRRRDKTHNTK